MVILGIDLLYFWFARISACLFGLLEYSSPDFFKDMIQNTLVYSRLKKCAHQTICSQKSDVVLTFCAMWQLLNDVTGMVDPKEACKAALKLHSKYLRKVSPSKLRESWAHALLYIMVNQTMALFNSFCFHSLLFGFSACLTGFFRGFS